MAKKDRVNISNKNFDFLPKLEQEHFLHFDKIENKHIYEFMLAMGLGQSRPIKNKRGGGWILNTAFTTADWTLLKVVSCTENSNLELNDALDIDNVIDYCDGCVDAGFEVIEKLVNESGGDVRTAEKMLLANMDKLYSQNVLEGGV